MCKPLWVMLVALLAGVASGNELLQPPSAAAPAAELDRFWGGGEYLLWWTKNSPAPPPFATVAPGTSMALEPGAIDSPDTTVVLGGTEVNRPVQHGARFTIGTWLDDGRDAGLEASYFFLSERTNSGRVVSDANNYLTNPFFDVTGVVPPFENVNFLSSPLFAGTAGSAALSTAARVEGAEANALFLVERRNDASLHLIGGFRYFHLGEDLTFSTTQSDPTGVWFSFPGQFVNTSDWFTTRNDFYGGQIGARLDRTWGLFSLQTTMKVALGDTHQVLRIQGTSTTNTGPNFLTEIPVTTVPGGIYAQPTNIGVYERDGFAVLPEVTVQGGLQLRSWMRLFVGYNFLYLSEVARPENQIDRAINTTQLVSFTGVPAGPLVGAERPGPFVQRTDFWAQGINFGALVTW